MSGRPVGILGASGAVGRAAAHALRAAGVPLRLGCRRPEALPPGDRGAATAVDLTDPHRLAAFCAGCRLVLNCAGPSYLVRGLVGRAALQTGADYVDVSGDDPAHAELTAPGRAGPDRVAVLSAGTLPGLSALVPRLLAAEAGAAGGGGRLTVWAGGLERCGPTVAADLVLSLNAPGTTRTTRPGAPRTPPDTAALAFFPGTATARPAHSAEAERVAAALRLESGDWYTVFPGRRTGDLMTELGATAGRAVLPLDAAAARLAAAAEADLAGRRPYYRVVFRLAGAGREATAVLGTGDSCRLTGAVGALTVQAVLAGRVPPGVHYAADVLDPGPTMAALSALPGTAFELSRGRLRTAETAGAL